MLTDLQVCSLFRWQLKGVSMRFRLLLLIVLLAFLPSQGRSQPTTRPLEGLAKSPGRMFALEGARIVLAPGKEIAEGTILIDGRSIIAVGTDLKIPVAARRIEMKGKTIYAGFIDSYGEQDLPASQRELGAPHWNSLITPQLDLAASYQADSALDSTLRSQGITTRLVAPSEGILKGTSVLVATSDEPRRHNILVERVAQHGRLTVPRGRGRDNYPNSPMGAIALARQTMMDSTWHQQAWDAFRADRTLERPERNDALDALLSLRGGAQSIIFDTPNELFIPRAERFCEEFALSPMFRGSGREYRRLDAIRQTGRAIIVPVNFTRPPNVGTAEAALDVSLQQLMHWDLAPENPGRLDQAGVPILLTSHGLTKRGDFLKQVRKAVTRGLDVDSALRALTTTPARLFGAEQFLGTIETGKLASLVVADGDLLRTSAKVVETWVAGKRHQIKAAKPVVELAGRWQLSSNKLTEKDKFWLLEVSGSANKLSAILYRDIKPTEKQQVTLTRISQRDARLSGVLPAAPFEREGFVQLTLVITQEDGESVGTGHWTWPDGSQLAVKAVFQPADESQEKDEPKDKDKNEDKDKQKSKERDKLAADESPAASYPVNYPLGAFGVSAVPGQAELLAITNATIWTCGPQGVLENATLLIKSGRIVAVGTDVEVPKGAQLIDASGKYISPGIIDCHSHMGTDGGVNEGTQAITAEVRIGDFIDANDITIYRQLAGGVTSSNILHGSANPIGGQNQVIKLRWGLLGEEMKFSQAPQGIKFALGENVKQSNWGDEYTSRYPQTRMGVEQIMRDTFDRARRYQQRLDAWDQNHQGMPPRRDLELDAMAEILAGTRWIHCHSYRQDEILALIRTLDDFDVTIGTFQHILEGYKVADAMAKHGAMGSAFSDWWAYKFEVYDAIPYNGALMHEAGVVVSFNSDDRELARHLNHEAAKAVKYGGVDPLEALKFVTLNPARQLRIDEMVGSLEVGKHADFVIWNAPPLSVRSRCEQTWIDGRRFFDRAADLEMREQRDDRRAALIQKVLQSGEAMLTQGDKQVADEDLWPREDIFCHAHGHDGHNHGSANSRLNQLRLLLEQQQENQD